MSYVVAGYALTIGFWAGYALWMVAAARRRR